MQPVHLPDVSKHEHSSVPVPLASDMLAILSASGHITQASAPLARYVGLSAQGLQGQRILNLVEPGQHASVQALLRAARHTMPVQVGQIPTQYELNRYELLHWHLYWLADVQQYLLLMVPAHRNQQSHPQVQMLLAMTEASHAGMVLVDVRHPELPMVYINSAFAAMTGYSSAESIGRNCRFLQRRDDPENTQPLSELRQAIREHRTATVTLRNYRRDGTAFFNRLRIAPIFDVAGTLTHYVGVQDDISDVRRAEAQLRLLLERAQDMHEIKSRFMSMLTHEVLNPISSVMLGLELLRRKDDMHGDGFEAALERMTADAQHVADLIDDAAAVNQAQSDSFSCEPRPDDWSAVVRQVVADVELVDAQHDIHSHIPQALAGTFDPKLLRLILSNLLSNAVKYSAPGTRIEVTLTHDGQQVQLSVADSGCGIPEADQPRIFEFFQRAANSKGVDGMGIGLAVVRQAVTALKGAVTFESTLGVGTRFYVTLPQHIDGNS
jgi:PAS domain S-box-containing protein